MIILSTAFTSDYKHAQRWMDGVEEYWTEHYHPLVIGVDCPDYGMPRGILQAGHFLQHLPSEYETIVFSDTDVMLHRPLEKDEWEFIENVDYGQIAACPNKHPEQKFAEESDMLFPSGEHVARYCEKWKDVRVFNTGFVVMKRETYEQMFQKFQELYPTFDAMFGHYAKIQLCMCSAAHELGLTWKPIPGHLCSQGHFGPHEGINPFTNPPTHFGRPLAFDHRISF